MSEVQIRIYEDLRRGHIREEVKEISDGDTVGQVVDGLSLNMSDIRAIQLNGQAVRPQQPVHEGDVIEVIKIVQGC